MTFGEPPDKHLDIPPTPEEIERAADAILEDSISLSGAGRTLVNVSEAAFWNIKRVLIGKLENLEAGEKMDPFVRSQHRGYTPEHFTQLAVTLRAKANKKLAEIVGPIIDQIRKDTEKRIENLAAEI